MNRLVCLFLLCILFRLSVGFERFRIVSPKPNAIVREKLIVQIPKKSVPQGAYVGFWINKNFIGAIAPESNGIVNNYLIDTKAAQIKDGKIMLQVILYANKKENNKLVTYPQTNTFVNLTLDNSKSIKVPTSGFLLRYHFDLNKVIYYNVKSYTRPQNQQRFPIPPVAQCRLALTAQHRNGSTTFLKVEALPTSGKTKVQIRSQKDIRQSDFIEAQKIQPIYLGLDSTGNEEFGELPTKIVLSEENKYTLEPQNVVNYIPFYLPVLPKQRVKIGDTWNAFILADPSVFGLTSATLSSNRITKDLAVVAKLTSVEWESGRRCAKINYQAQFDKDQSFYKLQSEKPFIFNELSQVVWIDLDSGKLIRLETIQTGLFNVNNAQKKVEYNEQKLLSQTTKIPRPGGVFSKPKENQEESNKDQSTANLSEILLLRTSVKLIQ